MKTLKTKTLALSLLLAGAAVAPVEAWPSLPIHFIKAAKGKTNIWGDPIQNGTSWWQSTVDGVKTAGGIARDYTGFGKDGKMIRLGNWVDAKTGNYISSFYTNHPYASYTVAGLGTLGALYATKKAIDSYRTESNAPKQEPSIETEEVKAQKAAVGQTVQALLNVLGYSRERCIKSLEGTFGDLRTTYTVNPAEYPLLSNDEKTALIRAVRNFDMAFRAPRGFVVTSPETNSYYQELMRQGKASNEAARIVIVKHVKAEAIRKASDELNSLIEQLINKTNQSLQLASQNQQAPQEQPVVQEDKEAPKVDQQKNAQQEGYVMRTLGRLINRQKTEASKPEEAPKSEVQQAPQIQPAALQSNEAPKVEQTQQANQNNQQNDTEKQEGRWAAFKNKLTKKNIGLAAGTTAALGGSYYAWKNGYVPSIKNPFASKQQPVKVKKDWFGFNRF